MKTFLLRVLKFPFKKVRQFYQKITASYKKYIDEKQYQKKLCAVKKIIENQNVHRQIFDCFMFFNELELLMLRFMYYYDTVDYFVLVESKKTFTGKNKECVFEKNKAMFSKYLDKVIYVQVDDLPEYSVEKDLVWQAENFQRNQIENGLAKKANIGDMIFVSDVDEFWDKEKLGQLKSEINPKVFSHNLYYYFVNCKKNIQWLGTCYSPYGVFTPQQMRDLSRFQTQEKDAIQNAGWHYTYGGGVKRIVSKMDSLSDTYTVRQKIGTEEDIALKIENGIELWNDNEKYELIDFEKTFEGPDVLREFIKMYPNFYRGKFNG